MKRYLKYGLLIISALLIIGLAYYFMNNPKESVLNKIPADVDYCFILNKTAVAKESYDIAEMKGDSSFRLISAKLSLITKDLIPEVGINPLGNLVFFGNQDTLNFAWIGKNEDGLNELILKNKWKVVKHITHDEINISAQVYLCYKWPVMLLKNKKPAAEEPFFEDNSAKFNPENLNHPNTAECLVYGMIKENTFNNKFKLFPRKGNIYAGLKMLNKNFEFYFVQPDLVLEHKLGMPKNKPTGNAVFSWPLDMADLDEMKFVPDTVKMQLKQMVSIPVNHLYAEVLDTFTFSEKYITYDMDSEFKLTQKITFVYKSYPGLLLNFLKSNPNEVNNQSYTPTDLGLETVKLLKKETFTSYIFTSDSIKAKKSLTKTGLSSLPDYYVYANLEILKTDPFWKDYLNTNFTELSLHADPLQKGSMFTLNLKMNSE